MSISEATIREIVEKVVKQSLITREKADFKKVKDPRGILSVSCDTVQTEPFKGAQGVSLKDIVSLEESPRMGAGIMEVDHTSFEWTLTYDEFDYIIEGTLEIEIDGRVVTGHAGDIIFIPKNSHIHFQSPDKARFAYFVYPADWQS
ncbi:MAG: hypothetical protein RHS_3344 [Robinsoniella sp. RHS]|uniref:cupin domain-containing protein n=1 Tax=Robinsoniella sp. RHS TaxID=1504536 RepID=UPI00064ACB28|nr:MAG: hypothetical protein RHS_3344 [Robinsoniella sp. RHS]